MVVLFSDPVPLCGYGQRVVNHHKVRSLLGFSPVLAGAPLTGAPSLGGLSL